MKRVIVLLLFSLFNLVVAEEIHMGILYEKIFISKKEANISVELWRKQMKEKKLDLSWKITFYNDEEKIINDYKNDVISSIVLDSTFYFKNKKRLDNLTVLKWIINRTNNKFTKYYLVKNKESDFTLQNLNAQNIFYYTELEKVWIEKLIYEKFNNSKTLSKKLKRVEKSKKLLYNVFFNKDTLAIVPKDLYESMIELNPQIKNKVEIISESKEIFFTSMGLIRQTKNKKIKKRITELLEDLEKDPRSFDFLTFIGINRVHFFNNDNEIKDLNKFYEEYFKLKKKN